MDISNYLQHPIYKSVLIKVSYFYEILFGTYFDCAHARTNPESSMCEVPHYVSRKLQLSLCAIMTL